jgi:thymidylate synthase
MNSIDKQYQNLLQDILDNGVSKTDRTGTGTISVFGRQIRHKMKEGFPLLTTKKMAWKTIVTELLWFLHGNTNIKFLLDYDCHIWDGDAYKRYVTHWGNPIDPINYELYGPNTTMNCFHEDKRLYTKEEFIKLIKTDETFAKQWGELGPIYGKQWRSWNGKPEQITDYKGGEINPYFCDCQERIEDGNSKVRKKNEGIDQIQNLINELKTNPDSRRLMVSAWNVGELDQMVLPPCHYGFQVYTRELSEIERGVLYSKRMEGFVDTDDVKTTEHYDSMNIPKRAISLMWNQRSVDTFLGLPFNIASYGLLLEIIAKITNMVPEELVGNLGDVHLYKNHIEQAKEQIGRKHTSDERSQMLKEAMGHENYNNAVSELMPFGGGMSEYYDMHNIPTHSREPYQLPKLKLPKTDAFWDGFNVSLFGHLDPTDFIIENYQSHPTIKAPLSN